MFNFEHFVCDLLNSKARRKAVIIATVAGFFGAILLFPTKILLAKMLPGKSDSTFSIYVDTPDGSSVEQTYRLSQCVIDILKKEKEVLNMELFLANGIPLDYAGLVKGSAMKYEENVAEILVNLTDKHSRDEPTYLMTKRLRPVVRKTCLKVVDNSVIKFIEQPAGPPTLASIVVEVYGENDEQLRKIAKEVEDILASTDGLVDADIMANDIFTKYQLVPDKDKIALSGLSTEQVNSTIYIAFEGMVAGYKHSITDTTQVDMYLTLDKKSSELEINSLEALNKKLLSLRLMNSMGNMVFLSDVVDIVKTDSTPMIMHKNLRTMINVVAETELVSQVYPLLDARETMQHYFEADYEVLAEPGITTNMFDLTLIDKKTKEVFKLKWDGEMKVTLDTFRDLGGAFIAALIFIFLLFVMVYRSFAISGIIVLASFLSLFGVIFGHVIADIFTKDTFFLTATSLIGFIALMGISSRNSLLLIDFSKSLMLDKGYEKRKAIALAIATRAKPIALTIVTIVLGSALLAQDPIFGGLGVALISGSIAEIYISFLVVPILLVNSKDMDFDKQYKELQKEKDAKEKELANNPKIAT